MGNKFSCMFLGTNCEVNCCDKYKPCKVFSKLNIVRIIILVLQVVKRDIIENLIREQKK